MATKSDKNRDESEEVHRFLEAAEASDANRIVYASSEEDALNTPSEDDLNTPSENNGLNTPSEDDDGSTERASSCNENGNPGEARLPLPGLGNWAYDLLQEIDNLKKENADLKRQHEARAKTLYETYYGQLKKLYDTDVGFERRQRIQAQELATQAAQFPDETHDVCRSRYQLLAKARDEVWEQHNQDVNEKRALRERLADLSFRHENLQTNMQEETARSSKLVEALTQSSKRAEDLTVKLSELQSIRGSTSNSGNPVDIGHNADRDSLRARVQEQVVKESETVHSHLRTEKKKSKDLQDELNKEQEFHRETQKQMQLEANDLDYYKTKIEAQHSVVNKYKDSYAKALEDLAAKDSMIAHKDKQLAIMNAELAKWQKQFENMDTRLDAREKELKSTNNKTADKPAADMAPKPADERGTTPEGTASPPAVAQGNASVPSGDGGAVVEIISNQVQALVRQVERLEAAVTKGRRGPKTGRNLQRQLLSDKMTHKALETQVATLQAEAAKQARDLATKEAEVSRLRDRLDHPALSGCERHDADLQRLAHRLDKLKGMSHELTGQIDQGSDALRQCGDAMKEQLRRL